MMIQKLAIRLITVFAVSAPLAAQAQYYTSANTCAAGVGTGIVGGGLIGFFAGMAIGGRNGPAIGGLAGAAAGGLLGAGLSCNQEGAYVRGYDQFLSRPGMCGPGYLCQNNDTSFMLLRAGYDRWRNPCRMYHYEIRTPSGWVGRDQTACYINGIWQHGYPNTVFVGQGWMRPQMTVVEMQRFPVLYQAYRTNYAYGSNYWNQYWARPVPVAPRPMPRPVTPAPRAAPAVF